MHCHFEWNGIAHRADLTRPVDLSTVLVGNGGPNPRLGMWILPP